MITHTPPVDVSICIASYNYADYIAEAIASVLVQSFQNWELIIVDDASSDDSVEIISGYQQRYPDKIKLLVLPENRGVSHAFNQAFLQAQGRYIAMLGADDRMLPARLEQQVAFLDSHPDCSVVCSLVEVIDQQGKVIPEGDSVFSVPFSDDVGQQLLSGNFINAPSVMFRKELLDSVGLFNEKLPYVQDLDYWLRVTQSLSIHRMDEVLTQYRVHGKNLSGNENIRYASVYETVFVILKSIKTRAESLKSTSHERHYIIDSLLMLAEAARRIESELMNQFLWSIDCVYSLALDVSLLDPENEKATVLLNSVYQALGDSSRALGITGFTLNEYQLTKTGEVAQEKSPVDMAMASHKLTGMPLLDIAQAMMENNKRLFNSDLERENFIIEICQVLFDKYQRQLQDDGFYTEEQKQVLQQISGGVLTQQFEWLAEAAADLRQKIAQSLQEADYQKWLKNHALLEIDAQIHAERMARWRQQPLFQIVVFLLDGEESRLADTIDSLSQQFYPHWKLTVIADFAAPDPMFDELDVLEWIHFPEGEDPYQFLTGLIHNSPADWCLFAPSGIQFEPHTFLQLGDYIDLFADKTLFYVDDDFLSEQGERIQARFKPDFNLDMLRSKDYIGVVAFQRQSFCQTSGFDALPGHENMDITFKFYEQFGERSIGHIQEVLLHLPQRRNTQHDHAVAKQTVYQHLQRSGITAQVTDGFLDNTIRVLYQHMENPKVSIIIPTRDKLEFLRPCVESVLEKTDYLNYELIIVDNESSDPDTLHFMEDIQNHASGKVRVIAYPHPFNYAAISNMAAREAQGEYLLFLNNDTEVLHGAWLERMMSHAQRPEVGIVGARLVYPETGRLQHAGVIMGIGSVADHHYSGLLGLKDGGYMDRAQIDQNFSAVTGGCLLIRKCVYDAVQGMEEAQFAVAYNDIDLCLKVREKGYLVVWTPYATLVHHGSGTLKSVTDTDKVRRYLSERKQMLKKWLPWIAQDPAYNRHLSLAYRDMRLETDMPTNWDVHFHDRTRVLGLPLSGASGDYRVIAPFESLRDAGVAQCEYYRFKKDQTRAVMTSEFARMAPDVIVFHAAVNDIQLKQIQEIETFLPDVFRIYTIDDLMTNIPEKSPVYREAKRCFADMRSRIRKALQTCHRLIVSTEPLAELCQDMIADIRVVPNRLSKEKWCHVQSLRNQGDKPRVGWAGAQQHQGDLEIIKEVVKATAHEVDWVFMGMYPEDLTAYIKEFHEFVPIDEYPQKLASLNLDLAVAPLEQHPFNEAKSNLRLLEYGILGWPVICSDVYPYRTNQPPVTRVSNEAQAWLQAIRSALADPDALHQQGEALKQWVEAHYLLEDHLDDWVKALEITPPKQV